MQFIEKSKSSLDYLEKKKPTFISYFFILCSALLFTISGLFIKLLKHLTPYEILYYRLAIHIFITTGFMNLNNLKFHYKDATINKLLITRGFLGSMGATFAYIAISYTTLSEATVIQQMTPVFVGILSTVLLKQKYDYIQFLAALLCITGTVLIVKPDFIFGENEAPMNTTRMIGITSAFISSITGAFIQILLKKVGLMTNTGILTLYLGLFSGVCNAVVLTTLPSVVSLSLVDIIFLIFVAIFSFLGQILMNRALIIGVASRVSVMSYVSILYAYIFEYVFLDTKPDILSLIGSGLIFSCLFVYLYSSYQKK